MHSVVINGKKYLAEDNAPLKESLMDAGFNFPCGGNGKCGKCRIVCPEIEPTDLDRRFLSDTLINQGVRVACDKKVSASVDIQCEITENKATNIVLRECSVAVSMTDREISICIVGETPVETVVKKNPLFDYPFEALVAEYEKNPSTLSNALRAVIGKESVELFEKYGAAKAAVIAIAAKEIYLKILAGVSLDSPMEKVETLSETDVFDLPAESLYILPSVNDFIGGEILAETICLKERSLLIDCEKTVVFYGIGENDDIATALWDCDYSDLAMRCVKAATKLMLDEFKNPTVYLYGRNADKVGDALEEIGVAAIRREKNVDNVVSAMMSFRTRSKLLKEKNRTTFIKIYDNDAFQNYLNEES